MTTAEKIDTYLDRILRYLETPWNQRDPAEFAALMEMRDDIYRSAGKKNGQVNPG